MITTTLTHEASLEPKEGYCITADCGCEINEYDLIYDYDGVTMCEDCFKGYILDRINGMSPLEIAEELDAGFHVVHRPGEVDPIWG